MNIVFFQFSHCHVFDVCSVNGLVLKNSQSESALDVSYETEGIYDGIFPLVVDFGIHYESSITKA